MKTDHAWKLAVAICVVLPACAAGGDLRSVAQTASPAHRLSLISLAQNSAPADAPRSAVAQKGNETKPELPPLKKLTVRVLDPSGSPVAGAHVGLAAHFGGQDQPKKPADTDSDGFVYEWHRLTDSKGVASVEAGGADLRELFLDQGLVVRQEKRHLVAVVNVDPAKVKDTLDVTLAPECRVSGKVMCPELKKDEKPLGSTTVALGDNDHVTLTCASDGNGDYHFFLPPGHYVLEATGNRIFEAVSTIMVPEKEKELVFEPMIAPASKLALLEGQPAPELRGAIAWKNGPPVTLASLKGRCVLLFFWQASSPTSLESIPAIIALYDKLKKYGLEVIGVQVDVDKDKKPVDSVKKLDEMLAKARQDSWGGRDIPFPVAIVRPVATPFGPNFNTTLIAYCAAAADYGVTSYPTVLLIDRHGTLVNELDDSEQSRALLEKTLGLKLSPAPRAPSSPPSTAKPAAKGAVRSP
jgi:peroxiredoxin